LTGSDQPDQTATEVFRALQAKARADHDGDTHSLLVLYAVESFLRRLAASEHAKRLVLKGGMLMAANDIRAITRDADLSAHATAGEQATVHELVAEICALKVEPPDGVRIDPATIRTETMRAQDEYHGVRCKLTASLGQARIPFALDFSFGDPHRSTAICLTSILPRPPIHLNAYPLTLNLAEKIVTAMQRRETNTRDRDFADLWAASRRHRLDAAELREHILGVARHRQQPLTTMAQALAHMPDRQQPYTAMVARMSYTTRPPALWSEMIDAVIAFIDPLLRDDHSSLSHWDPLQLQWR
jgi:hypothetical protein